MELFGKFAWCAYVWLLQTLVVIGTITVIAFVRVNFFESSIKVSGLDYEISSEKAPPAIALKNNKR